MDQKQASAMQIQAGQRLMVGFDGTELNDQLKHYIRDIKVGGIILFSRNLVDPEQIKSLCASVQAFTADCGQPPLFIGIDQEGGTVARLKPPFTQFAGNAAMKDKQDATHFAQTTARELNQVGINMNMAPVLDVLPVQGPSVMQERAFGRDPQHVAEMGATVIDHLQDNGIIAVAKHYPGIGRTVLDSHQELPDLDVDLDVLMKTDLVPFQHVIRRNVAGIMLSHIRYRKVDRQWPASLSPAVADALLRRQMGFQGLVLTDDLDMGAVAKNYQLTDVVRQCLLADVDIMLICHPGPKIEEAFDEIVARYRTSEALYARAIRSLERIAAAKQDYLHK